MKLPNAKTLLLKSVLSISVEIPAPVGLFLEAKMGAVIDYMYSGKLGPIKLEIAFALG